MSDQALVSRTSVGQRHLNTLVPKPHLRLVLESEQGLRVPGVGFVATFADGSSRDGRLDDRGFALVQDVPLGPVEIDFPDLDDIKAKTVAASVRTAFDERRVDEVFHFIAQSPAVVRAATTAYERYFNDFTGRGLVADLYQEISDPAVLTAIEGALARAGLPTRSAIVFAEPIL